MHAPYIVTLGTAGGPRVWTKGLAPTDHPRCGIATALVVGDRWYLIDCGLGVYQQIIRAGLRLDQLAGVFITHLHSDHVVDLNNVLTLAIPHFEGLERTIPIYGPGDRGALPPLSPRAHGPVPPVFPDHATPGIVDVVDLSLRASATDLNDRILDALRPNPLHIWRAIDIAIPRGIGYHPNDNPFPDTPGWVIHEDDRVRVTATLVAHPPIAPAFGFRFDTEGGSVTISGDTRYCDNLRTLAERTDLLLHEAIDLDWITSFNDPNTETGRASIDHHHKAHTTPDEAGRLANEAEARTLALHHLVPGTAPRAVWEQATRNFAGPLLVPADNDRIDLRSSRTLP